MGLFVYSLMIHGSKHIFGHHCLTGRRAFLIGWRAVRNLATRNDYLYFWHATLPMRTLNLEQSALQSASLPLNSQTLDSILLNSTSTKQPETC